MLICASCGRDNPPGAGFCNSCGAALASPAASREVRKTVTVLFCDLTGSTALGEQTDPEALRALLARYFERMKAIVEAHGGTVEKFIGDAVMAVFGVPAAHEDDALRACRAAVEMRDALPELGIAGRIGVNTGEVVTGTEERLATGDAVNVAARFEQAAAPGEVLIGEPTLALVREAVAAEPVEPLTLKGKSHPVPAYRLVSVLDAPERSHASRFVGRERELRSLAEAWERVQAQARCELVTVVGDAGVGKSRLVCRGAYRHRGSCRPGPLPALRGGDHVLAGGRGGEAARGSARGSGGCCRDPLPPGGVGGRDERRRDRVGLPEAARGAGAARRGVRRHPVGRGDVPRSRRVDRAALELAPRFCSCAWPGRSSSSGVPSWPATLRLEPLPAEQADALIGDAVSDELRERIARAAGGNPLFISEMLAMAAEDGDVDVPPTLKALLAARLDQLDEAERRVLERGSVEGEIFHRGGVQALAPEETQVTTRLAALVRRQLVRPDRAQIAGDDGYRFRHLLIRDAAYDALPKAVRADLHARFADWLDEHGHSLVERDEIVGYHLEQASRYRAQLGQPDAASADRAAARLTAAGNRAIDRQDYRAGAALLDRAAELVRPHRTDVMLELESAWAHGELDVHAAVETAEALTERAEAAGDHSGAMLARALALVGRSYAGEPDATDEVIALCRAALPLEEERGDPRRLALLWEMLAAAADFHQQHDDKVEALLQALRYQRLAGYSRSATELEWSLIIGPRPADDAMRMMDELADWRPPGSQDARGQCCSRCSAASTRRGRSPRRGRATCAR